MKIVRLAGVALGLVAPMALAVDRAEVLQTFGARVAVLATAWEPDLQAAVQGFSDQDLGFAARPQADPRDRWRAEAITAMPGAKGAHISVGAASCVRMGAETLRFYAETVDVTAQPPRILPGVDPARMQAVRFSEAGVLNTLGKGWLGPQPQGAAAVLSCTFLLRAARPMDPAALGGLAQGLLTGFDQVAVPNQEPGPMTGFIRFVPLLSAADSKDPLTHLGWLELSRIEQEGQTGAGQDLVLTFVAWRMEPGS